MQITVLRKTTITMSSEDVIKALKLAYPENLHIQALGDTQGCSTLSTELPLE